MKIDTVHYQRMRELIIALLRAYGVEKDLSVLDNGVLKAELAKALCGITYAA